MKKAKKNNQQKVLPNQKKKPTQSQPQPTQPKHTGRCKCILKICIVLLLCSVACFFAFDLIFTALAPLLKSLNLPITLPENVLPRIGIATLLGLFLTAPFVLIWLFFKKSKKKPNLPLQKKISTQIPAPAKEPHPTEADQNSSMSLMEHLNDLRRCLTKACIAAFVGFVLCFLVIDPIFNALVAPLLKVLPAGSHPIYTTLPEGFFIRMYIAFVAGLFVTSPIVFYQIWSFIAPGLYEEEKRYILPLAFISAFFFIGGALFCFFIVFPYAFSFFISFATEEVVTMPKISDYLDFVVKLLLAFGLIFEMPLFSFFLSRMGIITTQGMRKVRKYAVLVIFIVAAILTPPDVVSQILMAIPMLLLYELSILITMFCGKKKEKEDSNA